MDIMKRPEGAEVAAKAEYDELLRTHVRKYKFQSLTMRIPFALNSDGCPVSPAEVERGKKCGCFCPECSRPVIACRGNVKRPYFAHAPGVDCARAYESSLHKAVKWILEQRKSLLLPDCYATITSRFSPDVIGYDSTDCRSRYSSKDAYDSAFPETGVGHVAGRMITFDEIRLEQLVDDIRPDIVAYVGATPLFVEIAVTHFIDEEKEQKLRKKGVSTIELDFSERAKAAWTWQELEDRLLKQVEGKTWIINRIAETRAKQDREERMLRMASLLEWRARAAAKFKAAELLRKHYEPTHLLRFDTRGYICTCRVLLSRACLSINLENASHGPTKAAFRQKMLEIGAVFSTKRNNYELPASRELFLKLGKELYEALAYPRNGGFSVPDVERAELEDYFGKGIRWWPGIGPTSWFADR